MGKLFELIVVEPNVKKASDNLLAEQLSTFKNKEQMFGGFEKTLQIFDAEGKSEVEVQAIQDKSKAVLPLAAKVPETFNYVGTFFGRWMDVIFRKEKTNQNAKADIVIDGTAILRDVPVLFLLGMEQKLDSLRPLIMAAPTLPPGLVWEPATGQGEFVFKIKDMIKTIMTSKAIEHKQLKQSSDKHPDTWEKFEITKNVGVYSEMKYSGAINSADKAMLIERLDKLLMAVKTARENANTVEADNSGDQASKAVMGYLFGAWFNPRKYNEEAKV